MTDFVVNYEALFSTKQVEVVQTVDYEGLKDTLKWVVSQLQNRPADPAPSAGNDELMSKLASDNDVLKEQLKELKSDQASMEDKIDALEMKVGEMDAAAIKDEGKEGPHLGVPLNELEQRVAALEAKGDAEQPVPPDHSDLLAALSDRITSLEAEAESLRSSVAGLEAVQQLGSSKEDVDALKQDFDALKQDLDATKLTVQDKVTAEDLEALRRRLDAKADKSEIDALLAAGVNVGVGEAAAAPIVVNDDGAVDSAAMAEVVNRMGGDLQSLRTLLVVLQGRVESKADQPSLEDVRTQSEGHKGMLERQAAALERQAITHQDSINTAVDELKGLIEANKVAAGRAAAAAGDARGTGVRQDQLDALAGRGELEDLAARVAELTGHMDAVDGMAGKADAERLQELVDRLTALELGVASKADLAALDEVRLRLALIGSGGGEGGGGGGGGADFDELLKSLKGMLAEKAGQAELDVLKRLLANKVERDELEALAERVQSAAPQAAAAAAAAMIAADSNTKMEDMMASRVSKAELAKLAQQVGDMYAELERLRSQLALAPTQQTLSSVMTDTSDSSDASSAVKLATALANELQALKDQLELVAHATNILTVGLESARSAATGQSEAVRDGSTPTQPMPDAAFPPCGRERREPKGAYERLLKLLGSQGVQQKMDFFDPDILNKMAHKVAAVDALMKNPSFHSNSSEAGMKDIEAQIRKLSREMRVMRDRMGDGVQGRTPDHDHAMLSGRPLMGYRCLACDRPLEKLDERQGPHLPSHQMPIAPEMSTRKLVAPAKGLAASPEMSAPGTANAAAGGGRPKKAFDPSQRGPQNWYEDQHGLAADALPKDDVGPKLPPGGWKSSASGGKGSGLPDLSNGVTTPSTQGRRSPPDKTPPLDNGTSASASSGVTLPQI